MNLKDLKVTAVSAAPTPRAFCNTFSCGCGLLVGGG